MINTNQYHRHRFDDVRGYLHHRSPYLLVSDINQIDDAAITTTTVVDGTAGYLTGHFPGANVLPGAMMQEMTTQTAGILIAANYNPMPEFNTEDPFFNEFALGVLVKIKAARYRGFARPGDELKITVELAENVDNVFDFIGRITNNSQTIYRNEFQLSNIPSSTLRGDA